MDSFLKLLRGLGPVGTVVANVVTFLTTNWMVVMATIAAIYAGASDWATSVVQRPGLQAGAMVFLGLLWTFIGVTVLIDRRRPRVTTPFEDYRYGLTFEGLMPIWDPKNLEAILQFGIALRNFSPGPLRYKVEDFDIVLANRTVDRIDRATALGSFIPRGGVRVSRRRPFSHDDLKELLGKKVTGTVKFSIIYRSS